MSIHFLQMGEYINEKPLSFMCHGLDAAYALVGRDTGKLFGFKVVEAGGKIRHIYFHDIDHIEQIIKQMKGEYDGTTKDSD